MHRAVPPLDAHDRAAQNRRAVSCLRYPAVRGSSGPMTSRRSMNRWRASLVVLHPIEQLVELVGDVVVGVGPDAGQRGDAPGVGRLGDPLQQGERLGLGVVVALGDEQLGQLHHRLLVARLRGEHLPERDLVAGGQQRGERILLLGGEQPGDELAHVGLGLGADEAVDDLAVLERVHRRDATAPGRRRPPAGWRRRRPWPARPCPRSRRSPSRGSGRGSCTARTTRPTGRRRRAPASSAPPPRWGTWRR